MPQTIFVPSAPVIIPTNLVDRGPLYFDPLTKSTISKVTKYTETNACGTDAYKVVGFSMSVNELINCTPTQAATLSVSLRLPIDATDDDVDNLLQEAITRIQAAIP